MATALMHKCPNCGAETYCVGDLVFCPACKKPWPGYTRVRVLLSRTPRVARTTEPSDEKENTVFFGNLRDKLRGG